jgi:hypothetical protein
MKKYLICIALPIIAASCAKHPKKILVMSRGVATIDKDNKTINVANGSGHEEQTVDLNTADKVSFKITAAGGSGGSVDIAEDGYYIINAKQADTIIGSYQNYGAPAATKVFTQDDIKHDIDSLQQLTEGKNISAANRNFFILPNTAAKITNNVDAFIVGPYHQMTSVAAEDGKTPEVYRFYSIKEIRETIDHLQQTTKSKP